MSLILIEIVDDILVMSINRPDKRNALTDEMYAEMAHILRENADNPDVKVLLLKGEGEHFTAGNDLAKFAEVTEKDELKSTLDFMTALAEFPMPVIAQVRGMAVGIGTTMLLHCDFVYCDNTARFSMPFINLALVPEYGSSKLLPAMVGHRKAAEWLMLGEPFDGPEAQEFGIVNKVIDPDLLEQHCLDTAERLCKLPKEAMRNTKALMKSDADAIKSHVDHEINLFVEQLRTVAAREAFNAFLEKRKPNPNKYK